MPNALICQEIHALGVTGNWVIGNWEDRPLRGETVKMCYVSCVMQKRASGFGMRRLIRAGLQHAADDTAGTTSVVRKVVDAYNV